ncbi:MAG: hypothetical protein ACFE7E_00200 [Candidatus Hodarchaeota archaeon]
MIHNVYILEINGIPLISRMYGTIAVDATLMSGYFSAQNSFLSVLTGQSVEEISTSDFTFWFKKMSDHILIVVSGRDYPRSQINWRLSQISLAFILNLKKENIATMIDIAALKSIEDTLRIVSASDFAKLIYHVINGDKIFIAGDNRNEVRILLCTLSSISPESVSIAQVTEENKIEESQLIGVKPDELASVDKPDKYVVYYLDTGLSEKYGLPESENVSWMTSLIQMVLEVKDMQDPRGLEILKNRISRTYSYVTRICNLLRFKEEITGDELIKELDIDESMIPKIVELVQIKVPDIKSRITSNAES